jgi:hypothetical protein
MLSASAELWDSVDEDDEALVELLLNGYDSLVKSRDEADPYLKRKYLLGCMEKNTAVEPIPRTNPRACPGCLTDAKTVATPMGVLRCEGCGRIWGRCYAAEYGDYALQSPSSVHRYEFITRYREVVRRHMGTGCGYVPANCYALVLAWLKMYGRTDPTDLEVLAIWKRARMGKYGEHSTRVAVAMGKFRGLRMNAVLQAAGEKMCREVIRVWPTTKIIANRCWGCAVCDSKKVGVVNLRCGGRHNFHSYTFLLVVFLKMNDAESSAAYVERHLLKSPRLLVEQQYLWQIACRLLQWPVIAIVGNVAIKKS